MQCPVGGGTQGNTMQSHVSAVEEDNHRSRTVARLDRAIFHAPHGGMKFLWIAHVLFYVIVASVRDMKLHECVALPIDSALPINRNIFGVLGDKHAQQCTFACDIDSIMARKAEGRARKVIVNVPAPY